MKIKTTALMTAVFVLFMSIMPTFAFAANTGGLKSGGTNDTVGYLPHNSAQKPTQQITLQIAWNRPAGELPPNKRILSNTEVGGYAIYTSNTTPKYIMASLYIDGSHRVIGVNANNVSPGWHVITLTYNGSVMKLFIDGVLQTTQYLTGTINYAYNTRTYFGTEPKSDGTIDDSFNLAAEFDDFRIYNRALSDEEVAYYWNRALTGNEPGLVGYYPMDDGTLKDLSPTKNHGVVGGLTPISDVPSLYDPGNHLVVTSPANLTAEAHDGYSVLSWSAVPDLNAELLGYDIYVNGTKYNSTPITDTTATVNVPNNVTNTFYVVAVNKAKVSSAPSNIVTTMYDTISPLAPVGLMVNGKVTAAGNVDSAGLSWTPSSAPDLDGYNAYLMPSTKLNTSLIKVTSYTVTGLEANITYEFAVTAVDESGNESPKSNSVFYTFDTIAPDPPTNLKVSDVTSTSAKLTFNPSSAPDVMQYRIYANGELVGTIPGNAAAYTVTGLIQNTSYTFEVSAIDEAGNESTRASAAATTPISTIPVLTVASGHQQAELSWTPIAIAVKYYIYRDGVKIAETTDSHYVDNGLENGQEYTYTVSAVDGDDVEYDQSAPAVATPGKHSLDFSGIKVPFSVMAMLQTAKDFLGKYGVWILLALGVLFTAALLDPATKTVDQAAGRGRKGRKGKTKVAAYRKSADKNPKDETAKTIDKLAMTSTAKTSKPKGSGRGKRSREGLIAKQIPAERNGKKYLTTVYVKPENYKQGKVIYMGGSKAK